MKQIWPNYSYSPATNVLTLTGLNIDRDQLLLVTAADRGRIMYNFADSSVTASAFTSGVNTALTLVATTAGLTTTAALVIYYDDQLQSTAVSISNLPSTQTIAGTVNADLNQPNFVGANGDILDYSVQIGYYDAMAGEFRKVDSSVNPLPISGTVSIGIQQSDDTDPNIKFLPIGFAQSDGGGQLDQWTGVKQTNPLPVYFPSTYPIPAGTNRIGVVTIGAGTVTIGAGTAQIGSVTASISGTVPVSGTFFQATQPVSLTTLPALAAGTAQIGSVTASISSNPSGALTTRFGSVTTANTAQITTAVTNTSRKYLFAQNISTGSVTIGVGFSPTTTQGIQLSIGSGIVFDSFCPTGAVYWLGATTGAAWTILEG